MLEWNEIIGIDICGDSSYNGEIYEVNHNNEINNIIFNFWV